MLTCIARNTENRLKKVILGEVKVYTHRGLIYCDIKNGYFNHRVTVHYTNMELSSGIASTDRTVRIILDAYRNRLTKQFFKNC